MIPSIEYSFIICSECRTLLLLHANFIEGDKIKNIGVRVPEGEEIPVEIKVKALLDEGVHPDCIASMFSQRDLNRLIVRLFIHSLEI